MRTLGKLTVGDIVDWGHGSSTRSIVVLGLGGTWVYAQGASKRYWISQKELSEKVGKPLNYPMGDI